MKQSKQMGDAEFHLMKEEMKRGCREFLYGYALTGEGKTVPAIMLKEPLKDWEKYAGTVCDSEWSLANNHGVVEGIYLTLDFRGAGVIKICFEEDRFCDVLMEWFRLLIGAGGEITLNDTAGDLTKAIQVTNVSLDIPRLITKEARVFPMPR